MQNPAGCPAPWHEFPVSARSSARSVLGPLRVRYRPPCPTLQQSPERYMSQLGRVDPIIAYVSRLSNLSRLAVRSSWSERPCPSSPPQDSISRTDYRKKCAPILSRAQYPGRLPSTGTIQYLQERRIRPALRRLHHLFGRGAFWGNELLIVVFRAKSRAPRTILDHAHPALGDKRP